MIRHEVYRYDEADRKTDPTFGLVRGSDGYLHGEDTRGKYILIGDDQIDGGWDLFDWMFGDSIGSDMTALLGIIETGRLVVAADGGCVKRYDDGECALDPEKHHYIKSVALSKNLCIAFSGEEEIVLGVFSALTLKFVGPDAPRTLAAWEANPGVVDAPLADVRNWVSTHLSAMKQKAKSVQEEKIKIGVLLAGSDGKRLSICEWKKSTEWDLRQYWDNGTTCVVPVLPSVELYDRARQIGETLYNHKIDMEVRAITAIRYFARSYPDIVGESVLVRTYVPGDRGGFSWRWDDPKPLKVLWGTCGMPETAGDSPSIVRAVGRRAP